MHDNSGIHPTIADQLQFYTDREQTAIIETLHLLKSHLDAGGGLHRLDVGLLPSLPNREVDAKSDQSKHENRDHCLEIRLRGLPENVSVRVEVDRR